MENKLKALSRTLYCSREKTKNTCVPHLVDDILQKLHTVNLSFEFQLPLSHAGQIHGIK